MSAQHTPGPWQIRSDYLREDELTIIANVDGEYVDGCQHCTFDTVARCIDEYDEHLPNAHANARAITAVPDLISAAIAVKSIRPDNWDDGDDPEQAAAWRQLDAAIAKATGGAA